MIKLSPHRLASFIGALYLGLASATALALPEDREEPIHIQSDRATHDQRKGLTIYEGSVQLTQGTLRILADQITVRTDNNNQVEWVEAQGSPAHFEQRPSADEELLTARAELVRYSASARQVHLLRNAWLEQDGATMSGNRINYDMERELVKAEGESGTTRPRIEMVIPPQSRDQAADPTTDPTTDPSNDQNTEGN